MENNDFFIKKQKKLKRLKIAMIVVAVILIGTVVYAAKSSKSSKNDGTENTAEKKVIAKQVETIILGESESSDTIETAGSVKAETKVDVVSLGSGTIRNLYFDIGDNIFANKLLASISDNSVSTNYSTAKNNFDNLQNNLSATERLADEAITRAEIGVLTAEESVISAEIALQTSQDNFDNTKNLLTKSSQDTKNNAIISFYTHLNTIHNSLDQSNYVIKAEGNRQIDGISQTLSVQDPQSLTDAKTSYFTAKNNYDELALLNPDSSSIPNDTFSLSSGLVLTKQILDDTISVLDNTVANETFTETNLSAQKTAFTTLRTSIVSSQSTLSGTLQTLQNLDLNNKKDLDSLENAIKTNEQQLQLAHIAYDNSVATLTNAKQAKIQQLIGAQTSADNAQGQLNLSATQLADLSIKSPIRGTVTNKYVEVGTEVTPGQKVAQVSQTDLVKIEVALSSNDIYRISLGQVVSINDNLEGNITNIDPTADPFTKKVGVEVSFDNKESELIAETFVDVSIPITQIKLSKADAFLVPIKSVTLSQSENSVFVINDGIAKKIQVEIGEPQGSQIEILSGLSKGDELIIQGNKQLQSGDDVVTQ
jgi:RND family efflux transporter MFP subunit